MSRPIEVTSTARRYWRARSQHIFVTLLKPMTSGAKAEGRFCKQDFVYVAANDVYLCPAGERLTYLFTSEETGKRMRRYWTTACLVCGSSLSAPRAASAESRVGSMSMS